MKPPHTRIVHLLLLGFAVGCVGRPWQGPAGTRDTPVVAALPVADSLESMVDSTAYREQLERVRENPYESAYQTKLKGGYSIAYGHL